MGVREKLTEEAANYVGGKYGGVINEKLIQIADILEDVDQELVGEVGALIGDIAGINFIAGIEFGELRPEAAKQLDNQARQHEIQPDEASSLSDE